MGDIPKWIFSASFLFLVSFIVYLKFSETRVQFGPEIYGFLAKEEYEKKISSEKFIPIMQSSLDKGMIVAFDGKCPTKEGWKTFDDANGKVIFGAQTVKPFTLGETGGRQDYTLNLSNLPLHAHGLAASFFDGLEQGASIHLPDTNNEFGAGVKTSEKIRGRSDDTTSFSILPPYIALSYCIKT